MGERVADRHPRLLAGLHQLQERLVAAWRAAPEYPRTCRELEALGTIDHIVAVAALQLPSGILTMSYVEPEVLREARKARRQALRALRGRPS